MFHMEHASKPWLCLKHGIPGPQTTNPKVVAKDVPRGTFHTICDGAICTQRGIVFTAALEVLWRAIGNSPEKLNHGTCDRGCQPEGWRRQDHDCHQPRLFTRRR